MLDFGREVCRRRLTSSHATLPRWRRLGRGLVRRAGCGQVTRGVPVRAVGSSSPSLRRSLRTSASAFASWASRHGSILRIAVSSSAYRVSWSSCRTTWSATRSTRCWRRSARAPSASRSFSRRSMMRCSWLGGDVMRGSCQLRAGLSIRLESRSLKAVSPERSRRW